MIGKEGMSSKRIPIERIMLGIVIVVGVIPLVAVAPGLGLVLKRFGVTDRLKDSAYINNVLSRLKRKGYVAFEGEGEQRRVRITSAGRAYFNKKRLALLHRPQRRRWDGYWRIVMFDIPESQRGVRHLIRKELAEIGFKKLQGSVWVSPDECEEYIKLLKADQRIGKRLIYLKTKDIEYGSTLKKYFSVSPRG